MLKPRRFIFGSMAALAALAVAAMALYIIANTAPADYAPVPLSETQKEDAVHDLFNELADFNNKAQLMQPFTWSVSQEQINSYLGSLEAIEYDMPDGDRGRVRHAMEAAGLACPTVVLGEGTLHLMAVSSGYGKVIGVELALESLDDGRLRVRLERFSVGRLELPGFIARWPVEALRVRLQAEAAKFASNGEGMPIVSAGAAGKALISVLAAVAGEPIRTDITISPGRKRLRISNVEISPGRLTLHVVPLGGS